MIIAQAVMNKLLPRLRRLGIPCPDVTAVDFVAFSCMDVQTDNFAFSIDFSFGVVPDKLFIGEIVATGSPDLAGVNLDEKMFDKHPDEGPIQLQIADPEFFEMAFSEIKKRWVLMRREEDRIVFLIGRNK